MSMFYEALGDELNERRQPDLVEALVATGGLAIGLGIVGIAATKFFESGSKGLLIGLSVLLIVIAYGALAAWPWGDSIEIRPGAVALISVGILGIAGSMLEDGSATGPLLLIAALFAIAWAVPPTRGRPWLLGMALFGLVSAILNGRLGNFGFVDAGIGSASDVSAIALVVGLILLGIMFKLDQQGNHGALATPFAAVGNGTVLVGLLGIIGQIDAAVGQATLALLGGVVLVYLGVNGDHRRFTTWHGAIAVFVGLAGWVGAIYDGDNVEVAGILLAVLGVALVAGALIMARRGIGAPGDAGATPAVSAAGAAAISTMQAASDAGVDMTQTVVMAKPSIGDASAAPQQGAWHPDPMERHHERYWDGAEWTGRVRNDGAESILTGLRRVRRS